MSGSSPADLVVTFRSIPRRLREAQGDAPPAATGALNGEMRLLLDRAARAVGAQPSAESIADRIAAIKTREWDDATLDTLREVALEIGGLLRSIESAAADWPDNR